MLIVCDVGPGEIRFQSFLIAGVPFKVDSYDHLSLITYPVSPNRWYTMVLSQSQSNDE